MRKLPKRQLIAEPVQPSGIDALRALREGVVERIVQEPDGIAAWMLRIPPGGMLDLPAADDHAGARFYLVVEGEMRCQGERLPRLSTAFVSAEEQGFVLQAGDAGTEVLALQFPFDSSNAKETP
jgi:redox-sensitive bicupin YhaK (pirin superfamily)